MQLHWSKSSLFQLIINSAGTFFFFFSPSQSPRHKSLKRRQIDRGDMSEVHTWWTDKNNNGIISITRALRQSFWSAFRISFDPAKMQPHLNEVIRYRTSCSSLSPRDSVQTRHNLPADQDLCLIGRTRMQFTLIDSLVNE